MTSEKLVKALNQQINEEIFSSYLYFSMAAYYESINLKGFANWVKVQTQEELIHAVKIYDYINERNGHVILTPIKGPKTAWETPQDPFQDAYKHEQYISKCINELVDLAILEKDHATSLMLDWFVKEQIEEERITLEIVQKLKLVGDGGPSIYLLDKELAQRVFPNPPGKIT